jgi:hypothetical protein
VIQLLLNNDSCFGDSMMIEKRIIAREGLTVIVIMMLLSFTLVLTSKLNQNIDEEKAVLYNESLIEAAKANEYKETISDKNRKGPNVALLAHLNKVNKEGEYRYQEKLNSKKDRWNLMTLILNKIVIILVAIYPLYLLTRFVAWSIKTLRTRA